MTFPFLRFHPASVYLFDTQMMSMSHFLMIKTQKWPKTESWRIICHICHIVPLKYLLFSSNEVVPPVVSWFTISKKYIGRNPINPDEIGRMFINLAIINQLCIPWKPLFFIRLSVATELGHHLLHVLWFETCRHPYVPEPELLRMAGERWKNMADGWESLSKIAIEYVAVMIWYSQCSIFKSEHLTYCNYV